MGETDAPFPVYPRQRVGLTTPPPNNWCAAENSGPEDISTNSFARADSQRGCGVTFWANSMIVGGVA